jgi:hypothetical protein
MKKYIQFLKYCGLLGVVILMTALNGCEDPIPTDNYIPRPFIETFLIVDERIEGILLSYSQPIDKVFDYKVSVIKNASVTISTATDKLQMAFRDTPRGGEYYCPDTSVRVKPNTQYFLEVRLQDGTLLTASTTTPGRIRYTQPPRPVLYFPADTNNLNAPQDDSLMLKWTAEPNTKEYLIRITCLDTMEYGKYLTPATAEKNYRRTRFFDNEFDPRRNNPTDYGFITTTNVPTVWNAFKWFGPHEIVIYAADRNFVEWFKLSFTGNTFDFLKSNIKGNGIGVFGSASQAYSKIILMKYPRK